MCLKLSFLFVLKYKDIKAKSKPKIGLILVEIRRLSKHSLVLLNHCVNHVRVTSIFTSKCINHESKTKHMREAIQNLSNTPRECKGRIDEFAAISLAQPDRRVTIVLHSGFFFSEPEETGITIAVI
ncbi:hypothetical protein PHYBLDRAFT_58722 [Phycomyces blakesleeanus NRRL 1555(-)]|uniref:Uncharacterized protein n=1 Tax=Phycomyces blakesleeanus (strain ATCC 8743b / DSM 1359 / FGSC 10004 / NBRC 33097 / NRRL 1555) TaxID=763407 RepID=A0A167QGU0_PHYB8|nr:hypothetical protein PHYBLDRAFT_58722 [Phycomyces blakesleeanus NRRL 1555(-)]OAD79674.1 hypothetical protein PHYBLDRAFT_58722 [Phycomyces blakesleeanus NRRL 1555(-)]|eukprot:XP_018297714.1 hypothetical protein PHYBLDRAFT_58722 [Phycomyces blakesleeanus NRRL 1555(-)]